MKVPTYRYLVVYFFDRQSDGFGFQAKYWPLHMTIIPPFSIGLPPDLLGGLIKEILDGQRRIRSSVEGVGLFGPRQTVPVKIVEKTPGLQNLHDRLVGLLAPYEPVYKSDLHIGQGFKPHITDKGHTQAVVGQSLRVDSASLVEVLQPGSRPNRRVYQTYDFNG
jgi:2'-5' RNA ligase